MQNKEYTIVNKCINRRLVAPPCPNRWLNRLVEARKNYLTGRSLFGVFKRFLSEREFASGVGWTATSIANLKVFVSNACLLLSIIWSDWPVLCCYSPLRSKKTVYLWRLLCIFLYTKRYMIVLNSCVLPLLQVLIPIIQNLYIHLSLTL